MNKPKVLFVCVHNSARSQMAEAFVRLLAGDRLEAASAGMEPTAINPLVVEVMAEKGIDLSGKGVQSVFDLFKSGRLFDYVVTVCDESSGQACPIFPGMTTRLHWSFPDPSLLSGGHQEKLSALRRIRDDIEARVKEWLGGLPS